MDCLAGVKDSPWWFMPLLGMHLLLEPRLGYYHWYAWYSWTGIGDSFWWQVLRNCPTHVGDEHWCFLCIFVFKPTSVAYDYNGIVFNQQKMNNVHSQVLRNKCGISQMIWYVWKRNSLATICWLTTGPRLFFTWCWPINHRGPPPGRDKATWE